MDTKKIIAAVNAEGKTFEEVLPEAERLDSLGADILWIYNKTENEKEREDYYALMKKIVKELDIVCYAGCHAARFEDIKKAFYTGAQGVIIAENDVKEDTFLSESVKRFGTERIFVSISLQETKDKVKKSLDSYLRAGVSHIIFLNANDGFSVDDYETDTQYTCSVLSKEYREETVTKLLASERIPSIILPEQTEDITSLKNTLAKNGISVHRLTNAPSFSTLTKMSDGLLPVIIQDYKTGEILQLAYMNEESYQKTLFTGKMTYYSRSRKTLWTKGETSGHFQYLKSLTADCDRDTLLAKVRQVGAACHTGNRTCFFNTLAEKETVARNPLQILDSVYQVILDRKEHPKEGSYTNYLFDKGIDKILKKCGEEATEIVIAAKNPETEELKYEIADFLYHMMVLMAQRGVDWEDITRELAHRS